MYEFPYPIIFVNLPVGSPQRAAQATAESIATQWHASRATEQRHSSGSGAWRDSSTHHYHGDRPHSRSSTAPHGSALHSGGSASASAEPCQ